MRKIWNRKSKRFRKSNAWFLIDMQLLTGMPRFSSGDCIPDLTDMEELFWFFYFHPFNWKTRSILFSYDWKRIKEERLHLDFSFVESERIEEFLERPSL